MTGSFIRLCLSLECDVPEGTEEACFDVPFVGYTCEEMCALSYQCGQCLQNGMVATCNDGDRPVVSNSAGLQMESDDALSTADWLAISALIVSGVIFLAASTMFYWKKIRGEPTGGRYTRLESDAYKLGM